MPEVLQAIWVIRLLLGLNLFLFGVDQLRNAEEWSEPIPEKMTNILNISRNTLMKFHGVGNIVLALLLVLGLLPVITAWALLIWLLTILPFSFKSNWTIGIRDLSITSAAIALLILTI